MLATAGGGVVRRWNANAVSLSPVGDGKQGARCVRVTGDGSILYCQEAEGDNASSSSSVLLCPGDEHEEEIRFATGSEDDQLRCCDVDKSCRLVCAGSQRGVAYVWDVKRRRLARRLEHDDDHHRSPVRCLRFFEGTTGTCVASSLNAFVSLRSVRTRRELDRLPCPGTSTIEFSPTRRNVLAASGRDCVYIWDVSRATLATKLVTEGEGASVSFSPVNQKFLAAADGRSVTFWDMDASRSVKTLDCLATHVTFVTERVVCLGLIDGTLKSYDLRNTTEAVAERTHAQAPISSMHFSTVSKSYPPSLPDDEEEHRDIVPRRSRRSPDATSTAAADDDAAKAPVQHTPVKMSPRPPLPEKEEEEDVLACKIENLHIDMLRQFQVQHTQLSGLVAESAERLSRLVEENDALRRENHLLRSTVVDLGGILPETNATTDASQSQAPQFFQL